MTVNPTKGFLMSTYDQINPAAHPANDYPHQVRAFQVHAGVFAASMVLIFAVNLAVNLAGQWSAWWAIWALIGWGLGISVHGLVVLLARPANRS